jgi:hypothetical protein
MRMRQSVAAHPVRQAREIRPPPIHRPQLDLRIVGELVDDPLHHRVEQLIAVLHIPVQRHRADPQPRRHRPHCRRPDALLIHQL